MRVALVSARYDTAAFRIGENLGIKYLAAVLDRAGVRNDVFEPALLGLDNDSIAAKLLTKPYDLIGFSVMFDSALPNALEIIAALRRAGCHAHITVGGHVPTFNDVAILQQSPGIDSVVRFEGEMTLVELVENLDQPANWSNIEGLSFRADTGVVVNPARALIADLDSLPSPVRDETSRHFGDPHFFVVTTRGCPFACTFCSIPAFYKTPAGSAWRARSVGNVIEELSYLRSKWGARAISFLDDEFLVGHNGKRRAVELADEIRRRDLDLTWAFGCRADDVDADLFARLKVGGLRHVFVGIESGVQRVLDMFDKRTTVQQNRAAVETVRGLDLSLATGFIMFDPYTTIDELRENVGFLNDLGIGSYKSVANRVLVYRGTRLEQQLEHEGRLRRHGLVLGYKFADPAVALAYELIVQCLEPTHRVDIARRQLEYRLDNVPGDDRSARRLRPAVTAINHDVNASLADTVREILAFAETFDQADPRTRAIFEHALREKIDAYVSVQLDRIGRVLRQSEGGESDVG